MIIDTGQGIPEWATLLSSTLEKYDVRLSHAMITHWHGDHMGGVPDLLRLYPYLSDSIYKHTPDKTQQPIVDGQVFCVEGATLRAVHSPGHSHDHMCFVLEEENAMFTGDNVLGHGTAAVEQLSIWMDSLRAMRSHNCTLGYPAHGSVVQNLPMKIEGELATKTRREAQILQVLRKVKGNGGNGKGSLTLGKIVTEMHGDSLDEEVRQMAVEPLMEEILRKLAEDGRVAFHIRRGEKTWFQI
jgi:glyoxylase-like metal-dependent hydrolase (beta-lactamase superfamily II)